MFHQTYSTTLSDFSSAKRARILVARLGPRRRGLDTSVMPGSSFSPVVVMRGMRSAVRRRACLDHKRGRFTCMCMYKRRASDAAKCWWWWSRCHVGRREREVVDIPFLTTTSDTTDIAESTMQPRTDFRLRSPCVSAEQLVRNARIERHARANTACGSGQYCSSLSLSLSRLISVASTQGKGLTHTFLRGR